MASISCSVKGLKYWHGGWLPSDSGWFTPDNTSFAYGGEEYTAVYQFSIPELSSGTIQSATITFKLPWVDGGFWSYFNVKYYVTNTAPKSDSSSVQGSVLASGTVSDTGTDSGQWRTKTFTTSSFNATSGTYYLYLVDGSMAGEFGGQMTASCSYSLRTYTVAYNANGGSGTMANTTITYGVNTALRLNTFTRTGYKFKGWNGYRHSDGLWYYQDSNGNRNWYAKGSQPSGYTLYLYNDGGSIAKTTSVHNDTITMYAQWEAATYTVTYNANGGSGTMSSSTATYNSDFITRQNKFTRSGYTFIGWNEKADGSGISWTLSSDGVYESGNPWKWTYTKNITLYAQWEINTFIVSYDANGGSGAPESQTKTYNVDLVLSIVMPVKSGYNFRGWSTTQDGQLEYISGDIFSINANTTLYAVWDVAYLKPRISDYTVRRCTITGTLDVDGSCALVSFEWATDYPIKDITIEWTSSLDGGSQSISASGTSGSVREVIGNNTISIEVEYNFRIYISDNIDTTTTSTYVEGKKYIMDFLRGGTGIALFKPAEHEGFEVGSNMSVDGISQFKGYQYVHYVEHGQGAMIYAHLATFNLRSNQSDSAIKLCLIRRAENKPSTIYIRWAGQEGTDPELVIFGCENHSDYGAYLVHTGANTWDIYVKLNALDTLTVTDYRTSLWHKVDVTWQQHYLSTLPTGYYTCDLCSFGDLYADNLYSTNGTVQTSDRNKKENISELNKKYIALFNKLVPVSYELIGDNHDRTHIGFISQDVKQAMDEVGLSDSDFGGYCCDETKDVDGNPIYSYALRYTEFIGLNTRMIKENQKDISNLYAEIDKLKNMLVQ